jgi:hypothetical protein
MLTRHVSPELMKVYRDAGTRMPTPLYGYNVKKVKAVPPQSSDRRKAGEGCPVFGATSLARAATLAVLDDVEEVDHRLAREWIFSVHTSTYIYIYVYAYNIFIYTHI